MHRIKVLIRKFFGFSRTETNGFLFLLPLIIIILFSEPTYRWWSHHSRPDDAQSNRYVDSLIATLEWESDDSVIFRAIENKTPEVQFTFFDPNKATEDELIAFGMKSFLAKRIQRYREKGGKFYKKEDLLKVFGMDSNWYNKASPWITIALKAKEPFASTPFPEKKKELIALIDINTADSLQLMSVYGIGPALSKRIRSFRDKLGGFTSLDQLSEVYALDTTVVKELKRRFTIAEDFLPQQININAITKEIKHPYIKWRESQAIVAYRMQHGNFTSLDQLHEIKILTEEWFEKTTPYLTVK